MKKVGDKSSTGEKAYMKLTPVVEGARHTV